MEDCRRDRLSPSGMDQLWRSHSESDPTMSCPASDHTILPPRKRLIRGHHAAMLHKDVPGFVARLRRWGSVSAMALEFCILRCPFRRGTQCQVI
jgi:hypothetical protein